MGKKVADSDYPWTHYLNRLLCIPLIYVMTMTLRSAKQGDVGDSTMPTSTAAHLAKRETLNLRIKPEERNLIDRAAKLRGKNRTDFVLEAARAAAEDALLDQTVIRVAPEAYAAFLAKLDAPPQPNERLRQTMQGLIPWETK
jgi:uncharacterized protein (DUF1778 family)